MVVVMNATEPAALKSAEFHLPIRCRYNEYIIPKSEVNGGHFNEDFVNIGLVKTNHTVSKSRLIMLSGICLLSLTVYSQNIHHKFIVFYMHSL